MVAFLEGYKPHAHQAALHDDPARFVAASAGSRGGKTAGVGRKFVRRIYADELRYPGVDRLYWVVTPTVKIGETAKRELLDIVQAPWAVETARTMRADYRKAGRAWPQRKGCRGLVIDWNRSSKQLYLAGGNNRGHGDGPSNVLIEFRTTTDEESLVAAGLYGCWLDEAARCKSGAWKGGIRQRLADHRGWGLFSTTPMGRNWYYDEIHCRGTKGHEHEDPSYSSHVWRTVDNTALPHLAEEVEEARRQLPKRYFDREYEASFAAFIGQVYDEWNVGVHLVEDVERVPGYYDRIVGGLDFGWVHPGCFQVWGIRDPRPEEKVWRRSYALLFERWQSHLEVVAAAAGEDCWAETIKQQARRFRGHESRLEVFCDSARPDFIYQLKQVGVYAQAAEKDVKAGIETVAKAMHPVNGECPWFKVHRSAKGFAQNAEAYRWKLDPSGDETEAPVKDDDDAADAARYAIYTDAMSRPLPTRKAA